MTQFSKGDNVQWNTPQGTTEGEVVRKLTKPTSIQGHKVSASSDDPQYEVRSGKSGKHAAHKPDSLDKQ